MEKSFNRLLLGDTDTLFLISIFKDNNGRYAMFDQRKIYLDSVTVLFVRDYICEKKKVIDFDNMKLWKLKEVKHRNIKNQNISTEEDIVQKLKGEEMELTELFECLPISTP
ncbi:hypothetical protein GLOIN_2v1790366 [Rhizophagus clarus]|uniref:Uncharacterized protein n=1 Tax=Rhizophagus clarus TaxID=94130 RepID=A0A8H3MG22_9GLOM|nr:hypothetical protein GLOIN_2v1790366 [Rhizophagus clarus]